MNATVEAGVRTVIGFEGNVMNDACNRWVSAFFKVYAEKYQDPNVTYDDIARLAYQEIFGTENYLTVQDYVVAGEKTLP